MSAMDIDAELERLADILGVHVHAAMGLRSQLMELAVDIRKSPDVSSVSTAQWALAFGIPKEEVPDLLEAFREAGVLEEADGQLIVAQWEKFANDQKGAAFRRWLRSNPGGVSRLAAALEKLEDRTGKGKS